jgi:hypothetical protein
VDEKTDFRDQLQRTVAEVPGKPITTEVEQVDFRDQLTTQV